MNNEKDWLKELKTGDKVIVSSTWSQSVETVQSVTRTQIKLPHSTYDRGTGRKRGAERFHSSSLVRPTIDLLEKIEAKNISFRLGNFNWGTLSVAQLRAVAAIAKESSALPQGEKHE